MDIDNISKMSKKDLYKEYYNTSRKLKNAEKRLKKIRLTTFELQPIIKELTKTIHDLRIKKQLIANQYSKIKNQEINNNDKE